jgi:uncharacterized OsmC-like protein
MPKVSVTLENNLRAETAVRGHALILDEPEETGGDDTGPTPSETLLSAVASCMAITMKLYAKRKEWPLEKVEVQMESARVSPDQIPGYDGDAGRRQVTHIRSAIRIHGPLSEEQRQRIFEIGGRCPVHKTVAEGAFFSDELESV